MELAVIAWTPSERPRELAAALGGRVLALDLKLLRRRGLLTVRYLVSALLTVGFLVRHRPCKVVVQNPPIVPAVLVVVYARATGARIALDSHPGAFGEKESRAGRLFAPLHKRIIRNAAATMVASEPLARAVRRAGGRPLIVHEAPPLAWVAPPTPTPVAQPVVLWIGVYAADEPVAEVIKAAGHLPSVRFVMSGDDRRCPPALRATAPPNVSFTGYRRGDAYRHLISDADVVIVLTTAPTSVPRGAFEAIAAMRPLVLSDQPGFAELFPTAILVRNHAASIVEGVTEALARRNASPGPALVERDRQYELWREQRDALLAALAVDA